MSDPVFPYNDLHNAAKQTPEAFVIAHGLSAIHQAIVWSAKLQAAATLRAAGYNDLTADVVAELVEQVNP